MLCVLDRGSADLQQIDLVANAAELSALPFEAALAKDGTPRFLSGGGVVLNCRVRGRFIEHRPRVGLHALAYYSRGRPREERFRKTSSATPARGARTLVAAHRAGIRGR